VKLVVKVNAKVVQDDSGACSQIPVLISENNEVIRLLINYVLKLKRDGKSISTINNHIKATQLLLEYMAANLNGFENPRTLFEVFTSRLYTGTIDEQGNDPSGLYWLPCSKQVARLHIYALSELTDWMVDNHGAVSMNPVIKADDFTQHLNYAAWFRKNQHDFLGHIKDKYINQTVRYARSVKGKRPLEKQNQDAIEFPERHFEDFYFDGVGGAKDRRVAIRDQLILLLMHGGGLRESETLHLWLEDVRVDPNDFQSVKVRIYHPEDGKAPNGWKSRSGKTMRAAYLKENYGLATRVDLVGKKRVGWKCRVSDSKDKYIDVHWFPCIFGQVFAKLWQDYNRLLIGVERNHPYALVSFFRESLGQPYTLNAFHYNYAQGLKRIGLKPCKADGLSPHSHRHSYGRRLRRAGVQEIVIKKCLHHSSIASQAVYTTPTIKEVTASLNRASEQLLNLNTLTEQMGTPSWETLTSHGFSDIDPDGLFTGKYSKLRK
jgi:integrase